MTDVREYNFDVKQILSTLREWVEVESPTFDKDAVNRMMDLCSNFLAEMGGRLERVPGKENLGDCLRATFNETPENSNSPGILIMGHMDTVHPIGTLRKLPFRIDGDKCFGPGIFDMKSGNLIAIEAVKMLVKEGDLPDLKITILITSDEEIGSPSTRSLIESESLRSKYVLVPEPGLPDGGYVSGRYAIARFNLKTEGVPFHAGINPKAGKSAVKEMAKKIIEIEDLSNDDRTFSAGVIKGGQWVNCVSSECIAEVISMAKEQKNLDEGSSTILGLTGNLEGIKFTVERGVVRPVWEPNHGTLNLVEVTRSICKGLSLPFSHGSMGGGSDGNFSGALGVSTIDGLGTLGDGYHTLNEHLYIDSIAKRANVIANIIKQLK
ncbi:M20/M25/M40 family metallo-hydrolase [Paracoccaceae bacterium]|nr:M20/M25/M40 family metallo-hydrolase [Paracoccaceae bacterium]